jgi:hypothetical protein
VLCGDPAFTTTQAGSCAPRFQFLQNIHKSPPLRIVFPE